ncbi:AEC family transporter [Calidithermus chliarophilus]|uniref:AEC family transporter n=1 Tax=Calidithermus chliarophilus TaxID=52023 RepID=UPI000418B3E1|nr:AEC family transporter [Calidithermus chliarophilus]
MSALLNTVLPVALIVVLGYVIGRRFELDGPTLSRIILNLLVPALIFDAMYNARLGSGSVVGITLGFALAYAALALLSWLIGRATRLPGPTAKTLVTTALSPNSGNMGLSMALFALGQEGLERAVVYFIASSVLMFGVIPAFLRGGNPVQSLVFTLKLPMFWALAGGLAFKALGIEFPFNLEAGIHLVGQACIPLMLLTLGIQIAKNPVQVGGFELLASSLRLLAAPALAVGAGYLLGLERLDVQVLALQSAMPIAVNAFMVVAEFGGDAPRAARSVVLSSVLAFLTIPLILLAVGVG